MASIGSLGCDRKSSLNGATEPAARELGLAEDTGHQPGGKKRCAAAKGVHAEPLDSVADAAHRLRVRGQRKVDAPKSEPGLLRQHAADALDGLRRRLDGCAQAFLRFVQGLGARKAVYRKVRSLCSHGKGGLCATMV